VKDKSALRNDHVIFMIQKNTNGYLIMTGNYMMTEKVEKLKGKIEKVNSLTKEELRTFSSHILKYNEFSDKGGAGLGLIDMAKKTGHKLGYQFAKIDDQLSFFNLNLRISNEKTEA
jgi:hypothetical protein